MKMKRKSVSIIILTTILLASSMLAVTQAWWQRDRSEYVTYDLMQDEGPSVIISMDNSSFPIVVVESISSMIAGNITIGDKMYTYPDDFTYNDTLYIERNVITGEGIVRVHKVFTFNVQGNPTLESWLVVRMTGLILDPNTGQPVNPANIHTEGQFKLTGTRRFASVDGFGLERDFHHFGFIKGWPMK